MAPRFVLGGMVLLASASPAASPSPTPFEGGVRTGWGVIFLVLMVLGLLFLRSRIDRH
ncbi:MAG: hypothetical protein AB1551_03265 [Actinomycetota bacterium]